VRHAPTANIAEQLGEHFIREQPMALSAPQPVDRVVRGASSHACRFSCPHHVISAPDLPVPPTGEIRARAHEQEFPPVRPSSTIIFRSGNWGEWLKDKRLRAHPLIDAKDRPRPDEPVSRALVHAATPHLRPSRKTPAP
jgi:hypothetical protein